MLTCITGIQNSKCCGRTLSTFTTVDKQWHRQKGRWLSALEKLSVMGFPVTKTITKTYGLEDCTVVCHLSMLLGYAEMFNMALFSVCLVDLALQTVE